MDKSDPVERVQLFNQIEVLDFLSANVNNKTKQQTKEYILCTLHSIYCVNNLTVE